MHVLNVRNVNDAYARGMRLLNTRGAEHPSRNGPVLKMNVPVTTVYTRPIERILFDSTRDCNPFFHLFEALWMLDGRNDLKTLTNFLPSFEQFSDDGETLHGAYGFRWRHAADDGGTYDGIDQLAAAITMLTENENDRRVIIGMWDVAKDLGVQSKDIPCNDLIHCQIVDGLLDITVFCRSNDVVFGAYGANAVHMSFLHEYLAAMIGVPMGRYFQISSNYHAYLETPYRFREYFPMDEANPYERDQFAIVPLVSNSETFDRELACVMRVVARWGEMDYTEVTPLINDFFRRVAWPMYTAIRLHQSGRSQDALSYIGNSKIDWLVAGTQWISRRIRKRNA